MADELDDKTLIERDLAWREAITRGWNAEDELWKEVRPVLTGVLMSKFCSSPLLMRMVPEAVIVAITRLMSRSQGRALETWKAERPLMALLTTMATNQAYEWNKSRAKRGETPAGDMADGEFDAMNDARSGSPGVDLGESISELGLKVLCRLADAIRVLGESKPRYVIILALQQCGAHQLDAGNLFGIDKSQASNALKLMVGELQNQFNGEAGYAMVCDLAERAPEVWCGRHPGQPGAFPPLTDEDRAALRVLCESPGNKAAMSQWETRLLHDEAAQMWVAECLSAVRRREVPLVRDPVLQGQGERLKMAVDRAAARFGPGDFAALLGQTEALMHGSTLAKTGADAGTLWLFNDRRNSLEAVFNPTEPEMLGQLQPLRSGIISWAYKNDCSIRVARSSPDEALDEKHSEEIDRILGKSTQTMLAVPFHCAGDQRGVLSLVKLKLGATEFTETDQEAANALCEVLARTMDREIERRVMM